MDIKYIFQKVNISILKKGKSVVVNLSRGQSSEML